jgi:hypothetical protein
MLRLFHFASALTIYRLPVGAIPLASCVPSTNVPFLSLTCTQDEISLILPADVDFSPWKTLSTQVEVKMETGWDYFRIEGTLDFGLTGIVSMLTAPLADNGVSVFVISTFDTDYILIKSDKVADAIRIWNALDGVECV